MAYINEHYLKLAAGYLFPEIARRVALFQQEHPQTRVIKLGIGDVTEPLPPAVVQAVPRAVAAMSRPETFDGSGPYEGSPWLREASADPASPIRRALARGPRWRRTSARSACR